MAGEKIKIYIKVLKRLFPRGVAWEHINEDSVGLVNSMAIEFCRTDDRAKELLREFDPLTAVELLPDWEALLGLPDECLGEVQDLTQRQLQARQKLAAQGGISAAFLESVAARLGFNAIITDYVDFRVGMSRVGDRLSNHYDKKFRVGANRVGDQLAATGWRYVFEVNVEATNVTPFRVGINRAGDPLVEFSNPLLECTIYKLKPAHTQPFFTFRTP